MCKIRGVVTKFDVIMLQTLFCDVTVTFVYVLKVALSKRRLVTRASAPFETQGKMNVSKHFCIISSHTMQ